MLNMMMGVVAAGGRQSTVSQLFTVTVGFVSDKFAAYRGYSRVGASVGSIDSNVFDGSTILFLGINSVSGATYFFQVQLSGDTTSKQMIATPQNYGGPLGAISGTYSSPSNTTSYAWGLPNGNLYTNWAPSTIRTCLLEWA